MRYLLLFLLITAALLGLNQTAFAVCTEGPPNTFTCDTNPPNPDPTGVQAEMGGPGNSVIVEMLPGSAINTIPSEGGNGGDGINTDDMDDTITITDAEVRGELDGLNLGLGLNVVNISGSDIFGEFDGIESVSGIHLITVVDSKISGGSDAIALSTGSSVISVKGSMILGGTSDGIDPTNGPDDITIESSVVNGLQSAINMSGGDDVLTLKTGADMRNIINCNAGFDTLVFAMDVPPERLNFISSELAAADPDDDSITINGLFYEWTNCELLVNELIPVRMTRPIPTLSQWGLIAMAGILGIVGLIASRRRVVG